MLSFEGERIMSQHFWLATPGRETYDSVKALLFFEAVPHIGPVWKALKTVATRKRQWKRMFLPACVRGSLNSWRVHFYLFMGKLRSCICSSSIYTVKHLWFLRPSLTLFEDLMPSRRSVRITDTLNLQYDDLASRLFYFLCLTLMSGTINIAAKIVSTAMEMSLMHFELHNKTRFAISWLGGGNWNDRYLFSLNV